MAAKTSGEKTGNKSRDQPRRTTTHAHKQMTRASARRTEARRSQHEVPTETQAHTSMTAPAHHDAHAGDTPPTARTQQQCRHIHTQHPGAKHRPCATNIPGRWGSSSILWQIVPGPHQTRTRRAAHNGKETNARRAKPRKSRHSIMPCIARTMVLEYRRKPPPQASAASLRRKPIRRRSLRLATGAKFVVGASLGTLLQANSGHTQPALH